MNINTGEAIKVGAKVKFDNYKIEVFRSETTIDNKEMQQYSKLVLAGIYQLGGVIEQRVTMRTVAYSEGWEFPIPI